MKTEVVTIVIPTTATQSRAGGLLRAVESVLNQRDVTVDLIVVANGPGVDETVLDLIGHLKGVRISRVSEGDVSFSRYHGLNHSDGGYFGFLDDDDIMLPDSLRLKVSLFEEHPEIDVVVCNGYMGMSGDHRVVNTAGALINIDPARAFAIKNFFSSAAPLFRSATVDKQLFNIDVIFYEWTYLLFSVIEKGYRLHYDPRLTYRLDNETAGSQSKSEKYRLAEADVLSRILRFRLQPEARRIVRYKRVSALHSISDFYLDRGELSLAMVFHLRCLMLGGWRFSSYTATILLRSLTRPVFGRR